MAEGSTTPPDSEDAQGVPIGSFAGYDDAVAAVDRLAADGFPIERVAIVGRDLHLRRHDFSSVGTMRVGRYEVVADAEVAERASALLASEG
ncbi:MAG: hypothetical protein H0X56_03630 [Solirubrobacterales bacterium]|jgi:hypothetical protein|nr:hypothetical protein [Solirubrobacterales bacterium]